MIAGIDRFLVNQHNTGINPRWDNKAGCPTPYATLLIAARFGQDPLTWPYEHDAGAVLRLFNLLTAESKQQSELARSRGERFYLEEDLN